MDQNNQPLLTIGLPFFNNQNTLSNAIKSVLIQSYKHWELILIDDGSTDNSLKIANEFADTDNRISVISDGQNQGLIFRLNQIIDLAKGMYIGRMDSDDMMMPEKLEKQMKILVENPQIDVIDTAVYTINENDEPVGIRLAADLPLWNKKRILKEAFLFHATVIAKTSWYKNNRYDDNFIRSEDFELWCRTYNTTVFYRICEPLFIYREGNVNIKNYTDSNRTHRKILRKYSSNILSKKEFFTAIGKSHLKSNLYRIFSFFKMQYILTSKRNNKLNADQVRQIKSVIHQIQEWKLK